MRWFFSVKIPKCLTTDLQLNITAGNMESFVVKGIRAVNSSMTDDILHCQLEKG